MDVMQERQEKQAQIEHFVKSNDPIVRQYAQDQLKELWMTAYNKKSRNSGLAFGGENLFYI
jgi:hypothetical protein